MWPSAPSLAVPDRFAERLRASRTLESATNAALAQFESWLAFSSMPLFPDFTDHGLRHLRDVLSTADRLISDRSWDLLTPEDISVLIIAVLLHDLGMHLTPDGLRALVRGDSGHRPIQYFDDKNWGALWDHFRSAASRFSGRENLSLFGDPEPVSPPDLFSETEWTDRQLRLAGEFIRRHHAALGHQIAVYGVPGPTDQCVTLPAALGHLRSIAGLVARSHGMPLRTCVDHLKVLYGDQIAPFNVHAPFLMALLRIADYLQIHGDRAPVIRLRIQSLRSPVSRLEWKKHEAVASGYINFDQADAEAIYVYSEPRDIATLLAIRSLLVGLQTELDLSWAVLGEVYSLHVALRNLGLSKRRVKSNLDDHGFLSRLPFAPVRAIFEARSPDLLKLIVGPLYGGVVEVGVRELIQNAVDAVRELPFYCDEHRPGSQAQRLSDPQADVSVELVSDSPDGPYICVTDRGIGMTLETIVEYFLRAGASFRFSDAWKRRFTDSEGASKILRSGRFGIGSLALFLLGDVVEVSTRHISESNGIRFRATIDDDCVQLNYCSCDIGTSIRVFLDAPTLKRLAANTDQWDWYCLETPKVVRLVDHKVLRQRHRIPDAHNLPTPEWRSIHSQRQLLIAWTYGPAPGLTCNGIVLSPRDTGRLQLVVDSDRGMQISTPHLSLFDPDGILPLNLQRTDIRWDKMDFWDELSFDIGTDFAAGALAMAPVSSVIEPFPDEARQRTLQRQARLPERRSIDFHYRRGWEFLWWVITSEGISVLDPWNLDQLAINRFVFLQQPASVGAIYDRAASFGFERIYGCFPDAFTPPLGWGVVGFRTLQGESDPLQYDIWNATTLLSGTPFATRKVLGARALMARRHSYFLEPLRTVNEVELGNLSLVEVGECDWHPLLDYALIAKKAEQTNLRDTIVAEFALSSAVCTSPSPLGMAWKQCLGSPLIPIALPERRSMLESSTERLRSYYDQWLLGCNPVESKEPEIDTPDTSNFLP